ncbi:MAG: GNAT family N-acetyltransferase [Anaerolineae bacterium]|nr:GNAT family N-acetyltransferase [Anaerolineae bacterium]
MTQSENIRPFDIRRDLDAMIDLIETAFAGELEAWGGDFREQIDMAKQMLPLLSTLRRVSKKFQHIFDGFVWEEQGRIVSMVTVLNRGLNTKRWLIANVATHPDYRRRGLARQLVARAMEHARSLGAEICTLDVHATATPAYNLYRSLGFVHYDSQTAFKLERIPDIKASPLPGYRLRTMKLGEWRLRYELALRETPPEVQGFLPVSEADFRILPIEHVTNILAQCIQQVNVRRWAIESDGELAGTVSLAAYRKSKVHHELSMCFHPAHRQALAEPLLTLALETLQTYPPNILRTEARTCYTDLRELFKKYGFVEMETNHRLGVRFD